MPDPDLIVLFAEPLNRLGVRYFISGSVAAMLYGEPRVTHDIDFVAFLRLEDAARLPEVYPQSEFYIPPIEILSSEMARKERGQFNVIHSSSGLKADFYLTAQDELNLWGFRNIRRYTVGSVVIPVGPPECVIVSKLEYFREGRSDKHLRDIRSMLAVSHELIDRAALVDWIRRRGLEAEWKLVSA